MCYYLATAGSGMVAHREIWVVRVRVRTNGNASKARCLRYELIGGTIKGNKRLTKEKWVQKFGS